MAEKKVSSTSATVVPPPAYMGQDLYKLKAKLPGWRVRFVRPNDVERRKDEGWVVITGAEADKVRSSLRAVSGENSSTDSTVKVGGAVLMKIQEASARERDKYFQDFHKDNYLNKLGTLKEKADEINSAAGSTVVRGVTLNDESI
jgi:hypothetical protein